MTHPTGSHTEGVELAAGYVSVGVRVEKALDQLKTDLKGVEAQAETSAVAAKGSIMRHIGGAGAPAAEQLSNDLKSGLDSAASTASMSFRDKFWHGFLSSSGVNDIEMNGIGKTMASRIAGGFTNEIAAQGSILRPMAAAIRAGSAEAEAEGGAAGHRVGGRLLSGLATAMENGPGIVSRGMHGLTADIERAGTAAWGGFEGASIKAAEHAKSGLMGIGGAAMGLVSGPMAALIAAGTTIGGTFEVLKGGFERLDAIETFELRLKALGLTAAQSKTLVDGLNEATKGTQFHLTDVMGVGQRALQQDPNMSQQQVADYVKTLENAAAISGKVDVDSLGRFIDRIHTLGSLSMPRQLTQLTTAGLPIAKWLMDDLHMSSDELDKFIKEKKLTYDVFMQELQKHTAGGAAEMSKTLGAQSKIMGDNINRIGGDLLTPFFGQTGGFMQTINSKLEGLDTSLMKPQTQATIKRVGDLIEGGVKDVFGGLTAFFKGGVGHWGNFFGDVTKQFMSGAAPGGLNHGKGIDAQDVGHALGNVAHAAENLLHALDNMGHAAGNVAHATGNVVHALSNVAHAGSNVNHALEEAGKWVHNFIVGEAKFDEWILSLPGKFGSMIEHVGGAMVDKVGGFFSNFHPTILGHRFASGGINGGSAMIQSPVGSHGLVQWAEPSTGGEAFIPLNGGKRSQEIWLETGRLLGMMSSYAPGGIRGGGTNDEGHFSRFMRGLDQFSDRLDKLHKGFDGFNDSLRRAKGGDLQGGLDGLTKTVKDLTPVAKDLKDGLQGAKDALPDSIPGLPHLSRPTSVRDKLRNFDTGAFADRTRNASDAAQRINDITSQMGYGANIPGLDALSEGAAGAQEGHELHNHLQNVIQSVKEGHHKEALNHGADLVNVAASLSKRLTGFDLSGIAEPVNEAVGLQWGLEGLGKTLSTGAKGLESRALPGVLSKLPGALGTLGEGLASDVAAPAAIGIVAGKELSDWTMSHNIAGIGDRMKSAYDDQGVATNPVERFLESVPLLGMLKPSDDIRLANKRKKEEAERAARPWDHADDNMLLNPANAPKALPPTELASAITSDSAPGQMSDEDLSALGYAGGTPYAGYLPGYSKRDNLLGHIKGNLFGLAGGEAIIKTEAAQQPWVRALVNKLNGRGYAGGTAQAGYDFVSSVEGTPYSQGARDDCSGMASQVINSFLGLPPRSSMFTTRNEREWLLAHGFVMGQGPPGTLRVGWYNHGSAPDDGHTAVTLPNGTPVEAGGSHDNFMAGGGAAGADSGEFDQHAYLPLNQIQGQAVGGIGGDGAMTPSGSTGGSGGGGGGGSAGGGGGGAYGPQGAATALIGAGYSAAQENLPPGFSNPMEWGAVKSGAALFRFLGALGKAKGMQGSAGLSMIGDLMGGNASGVVGDISELGGFGPIGNGSPQDAATLSPANLALSQGNGMLPAAGQGGDMHIDQSQNTTFTGDIHDTATKQHGEKVKMDRAKKQLPVGVKGSG